MNRKKLYLIIGAALVLAFVLSLTFLVTADDPAPMIRGTLTTNNASYARGEKITLTANVTENTGFGALVMAFEQFPEGIARTTITGDGADATTTGVEVNGNIADSLLAGKSLVFDTNDGTVTTKTGTLFTGTYSIPQEFAPGEYTIKAKILHIARGSGSGSSATESEVSNVDFATVTFTVTDDVVTTKIGDLDGNGKVNLKDLVLLQQYVAKWNVQIDEVAADIDGNGKVNLKDLVIMQQYIAKWPSVAQYFE